MIVIVNGVLVPKGTQDSSDDFVDVGNEINVPEVSVVQSASLSQGSDVDEESDGDTVSTISDSDYGDATTVVDGELVDPSEDSSDGECLVYVYGSLLTYV